MTDLRALTDAFTELERRADAATERAAVVTESTNAERSTFGPPRHRRRAPRLVPVAAGLAVVAGLVAGAAVLTRDQGGQTAAQPITPPATTGSAPVTGVLTPDELADRFRAVLGDTATFTVTDTGAPVEMHLPPISGAPTEEAPPPLKATPTATGAGINGTLTAEGVTGGYDLQIYQDRGDTTVWCDAPDPCDVRTLADGTQVAVGQHQLNPGVTYMVNVRHPDGSRLLMHLSNQRSPKGQSELLAPQPPLTIEQLVAIATSDRW